MALGVADVSSRIKVWYNFFLSKPWQVELWLQRGKIAFPFIEERLRSSGMPLDLKYIAVAESNLNPRAISAAEAEGPWQFMERTAESFGLRIDAFIDERGDFIKSTDAAVSYLQRAREEIGSSWFLVCASFNLGIRGVQERILRQNSANYWEMVFPPETEDYVPKIIAIKLIMENAEELGFKVEEDRETIVKLEVETVEKPIYLRDIAGLLGLSFREIWLLNPHIWKSYLPPGSYFLYLPASAKVSASDLSDFLNSLPYAKDSYTLREGETLRSIADGLGISLDELMSFNNLTSSRGIKEGTTVIYWTLTPSP